MKQAVVTELSTKELFERLDEEINQLSKLKLHHAVSSIENPNRIKEYRKSIARLKTEIRNRELVEKKSQK
ncbi:MAG: 50S ribosomal protein L29 [Bacteroidales bacterium]|jgi:large subunit ribosomal protein L29|nr:50S ribosomal protein L29 [Bacteroidales bacterium]MDY0014709.1 50S ribosomal protein L29 [Bacteroidales bacterium]